jgi:hypothetical protein
MLDVARENSRNNANDVYRVLTLFSFLISSVIFLCTAFFFLFFLCITFFTFSFISPKSQLTVPNLSQSKSQLFTTSLRYGFVAAATSFHFLRRGRSFVVVRRHRCRLRIELRFSL